MSNLEASPAAPPAALTHPKMQALMQQQPSADQLMEMIHQTKLQLKPEKPEKFSGAVQSTTEVFNWVLRPRGSGWVLIPTAFPNVETRLPGQGDHVQGSRDLRSHDLRNTRSRDFQARQANRRDGSTSSHFEPGEPTGGMARRARISSQVSQQV